jgi:hypothetical protein
LYSGESNEAMQRWLAIAGLTPLIAAAGVNAQPTRPAESKHISLAERHGRAINLRLTQEPGFDLLTPATTGIIAETEVAPNARIGFHLMTVSRPRLGPEWRTDGRSTRSRKPAVSFTFRF